jgi:hypothetical protein
MRSAAATFAVLVLLAAGSTGAQPVVPGLVVTTHATAAGPAGLTFRADGTVYAGRDVPGSTTVTEQLIHEVPPGPGPVEEYGPFGIADPLGVLVDATGAFTTEAGSVIVAGPVNGTSGQIVAIRPSASEPQPGATVEVLHAAATPGVVSPSYLAEIGTSLLIVDSGARTILRYTDPGPPVPFIPAALVPTPTLVPRFVAVGGTDRIYVSYGGGTIQRFDATGADVPFAAPVTGLTGTVPIAVAPAGADFAEGLYAVEGGTGKLFRIADDGSRTEVGHGFPSSLGEIEFGPDGALYASAFSAGRIYRIGEPLPPPPAPDLGPFLCYNAKPAAGATPVPKVDVGLVDALETRDARIGKAKGVCSPATVTVGAAPPIANPDPRSLGAYQLRWVPPARHTPQTVAVTNALGSLALQTLPAGADRGLVPSAFSTTAAPTPHAGSGVDPFACYKVRLAAGATFARTDVSVLDPLGPGAPTARALTLRKPKHLCLPVDVNGVAALRPDGLLVCYAAKPARGAARSTVRSGMHLGNLLGADQQLDMLRGATTSTVSTQRARVAGDAVETFTDEGTTRPGEWDLDDSEGPRWAGGGALGEGESLKATFTDAETLPEGAVRRWRVFVEIDIAVNDTNEGPGVVMRSSGIPGIPDGTEVRAMASGKPAGLRATSPYFTAPGGTTLADLAESEQTFEANGDGSSGAFAFQIKSYGIEYELAVTTGGAGTGVPEAELCLPSTSP